LSIFNGRFQLKEQFCLIDTANFEDAYDTFTSVEKQIETATVFILNKIDTTDNATIAKVRQIVSRHHPDPVFIETRYADIPLEKYLPTDIQREKAPSLDISVEELDRFINGLMAAPGISMTPPDQLLSKTLTWSVASFSQLEEKVAMIPAGVARAKGIVKAGDDVYLFNNVMGKNKLEKIDEKEGLTAVMNRVVVIGPPAAMEQLDGIDFKNAFQEE